MTWQYSEELANQLRKHVVAELHFGLLTRGSRLPSAREIANRYGVHQRIAIAAYHALEREGLVELRPRSGVYVAAIDAPARPHECTARWAADVLAAGLSRGVAVPELAERLRSHAETVKLRAACVECNGDQQYALCDELRRDYGIEATSVELEHVQRGESAADDALRRANLVLTTAPHESIVRRAASRVGRPFIAVTLRGDIARELAGRLRKGPVYYVATDPRFGPKLRETLAPVTGGRTVEMLVVGRDEIRVPRRASVYVTRSARATLAGSPLLERAHSMEHAFSGESARAIIDHLVNENARAVAARA